MSTYHPSSPAWEPISDHEFMKAMLRRNTWRPEHDADVILRGMALPFYPNHRLIMARCPHWTPEPTALYWLVGPDDTYPLVGVSPPIHEANAKSGQRITKETSLAYLIFFCHFVHGEDGPFAVLESLDNPYLPPASKNMHDLDAMESRDLRLLALRHQSPRYHGTGADGRFRYSATLLYSNAIFLADLLIHPSGMIEMLNDAPLITDLSFQAVAPMTLSREFQP